MVAYVPRRRPETWRKCPRNPCRNCRHSNGAFITVGIFLMPVLEVSTEKVEYMHVTKEYNITVQAPSKQVWDQIGDAALKSKLIASIGKETTGEALERRKLEVLKDVICKEYNLGMMDIMAYLNRSSCIKLYRERQNRALWI